MWVKKTLSPWQIFELRDHRDNTAWELIKVYTKAQISYMDGISEECVRWSRKYLPVRVDSWPAMDRFRRWLQAKPYRIMYVRLDEIRALYHKRTWNKLQIELKK